MGIPALRVQVETPNETQFVGQELSKDFSDLRGEPARRGGVRQITLSVFSVDPLKLRVPKKQQLEPTCRPRRNCGNEDSWSGGSYNTIMFPDEFRNLDSRPYLKSAYEGTQESPEWKATIYVAALTRYLREEGHSADVLHRVQ